ncbi:hypothetical protein V2G26_014448 [Clonostachys chloroleuca]
MGVCCHIWLPRREGPLTGCDSLRVILAPTGAEPVRGRKGRSSANLELASAVNSALRAGFASAGNSILPLKPTE